MASVKVASLLLKTLAKPIAGSIKQQAKEHPRFNEFCISIAQRFHRFESQMRMQFLDYEKSKIRPLNDVKAVEQGANLLSELIVFGVAVTTIVLETWRSTNSSKKQKEELKQTLTQLQEQIDAQADNMQSLKDQLQSQTEQYQLLRGQLQSQADILNQLSQTKVVKQQLQSVNQLSQQIL
ncbi:optic atrophy 3 protein-domain-containing protein [Gorgonomyces haynaldii]|nr:optic atrophy 3 protein-domain-containing protein [Gorgonomyces haynaldii]